MLLKKLKFNPSMYICRTPIFVFLIGVYFFVGCRGKAVEVISEEQEKHYLRGKSLLREGRNQEALSAFFKVIEKRKDAAESHLEVGRLYLTHIKDPIAAVYHFRKFLALKPDSAQARFVRQLIETAKKEFARGLPGKPFESEIDRLDLMELVEQMKVENLELKKQLVVVRQQVAELQRKGQERDQTVSAAGSVSSASTGRSEPSSRVNEVSSSPHSYTVKPGDNLSRISIKVYGTRSRWMEIYEANRDILSSPHALKVGQELKIP